MVEWRLFFNRSLGQITCQTWGTASYKIKNKIETNLFVLLICVIYSVETKISYNLINGLFCSQANSNTH